MFDQAVAQANKQVGRVRLRLFFQIAMESLMLCWAISLLAATGWFLVRPFAFAQFGDTLRWSVSGAMLGVGTAAGLTLAWLRRPDRVTAALALDEKFKLQERVTTFLTLPKDQLETPVGQALLGDVSAQLAKLEVRGQFPLQMAWRHLFMPGALALALLASVLDPMLGTLSFSSQVHGDQPRSNVDVAKIQEELDKLKTNVAQRNQQPTLKSDDLKKLEEEFEKLLNKPLDMKNEEKVRERINEFRKLEDRMKERLDGVKEKAVKIDALKRQLEKLGLDKEKMKDGPAKDFEEALRKGDLDKAKAALERLVMDLKNDKLDAKQKKELADQLKNLQEQMKKVMDDDQLVKKLKQDFKDGKISKNDLAREMENFKHLQDLAQLLGGATDALEHVGDKEAGKLLDDLLNRFGEMELTDAEVRELLRDQGEIQDALDLLADGLDGDGLNAGRRPGGRRPIDPDDPNGKIRKSRSRNELDKKGVQRVTDYMPGGTFNKIPAEAVGGQFRQAAQVAPDAIDRQQIPEDAAEIARRYFEKLGNQK